MTEGNGAADEVPLRIGNTERSSAMKALDEHLAAGRLGVEEYADRSAVAAGATVASELRALFTDLPAPHPDLGGASVDLMKPAAAVPAVRADGTVATRAQNFFDTWGGRVAAVTPIVALALFFITGQWWFFLLIPAVGALVYGGHHDRDDHREQRRLERRDRRRG